MIKRKELINNILNSNLTNEDKREAIYIIEQYNKNNAQDVLSRLFVILRLADIWKDIFGCF
jgi:hypothetical protein